MVAVAGSNGIRSGHPGKSAHLKEATHPGETEKFRGSGFSNDTSIPKDDIGEVSSDGNELTL